MDVEVDEGPKQAGRAGEVVDVELLGVAPVGQVAGAQQVAGGRWEGHGLLILPRRRLAG
jgi:hypothetical protein